MYVNFLILFFNLRSDAKDSRSDIINLDSLYKELYTNYV